MTEGAERGRPKRKKTGLRVLNAILLLLGMTMFAWLLMRTDLRELAARCWQARGWFFAALAAYLGENVISALAWREMLDAQARPRFGRILAVFWAGQSVNSMMPGSGSGEVLRGAMLSPEAGSENTVASLVMWLYTNTASIVVVTLVGPLVCLVGLDLPLTVVGGLLAAGAVLTLGMILVGVVLRRGLIGKAIWLAQRLPILRRKDLSGLATRAVETDRRIRDFRRDHPRAFRRAVGFTALVRAMTFAEAGFLMAGLFPEMALFRLVLLAMLAQSATHVIAWGAAFVPGRVGVAEGGQQLLFQWIGLDPVAGLTFGILRRVQRLIGVAIGLGLGGWSEGRIRTGGDPIGRAGKTTCDS